jgi:hypothetical protein
MNTKPNLKLPSLIETVRGDRTSPTCDERRRSHRPLKLWPWFLDASDRFEFRPVVALAAGIYSSELT